MNEPPRKLTEDTAGFRGVLYLQKEFTWKYFSMHDNTYEDTEQKKPVWK